MKQSFQLITLLLAVLSAAQAGIVQSPSQSTPTRVPIKITSLSYKELKEGKHQIIVNWGFDPGEGVGVDGGGGVGFTVTKLTIDLELTDAKGFKQKVTKTLTNQSGSGSVSITPIPIPKDPMVGVPITELFRGNIDPRDLTARTLKFKVTLTGTAISDEDGSKAGSTSTRRIPSGIGCSGAGCSFQKSKEGTIQVLR